MGVTGGGAESALARIERAGDWDDFLDAIEEAVVVVGAAAFSLGVRRGVRVDTYTRGFAEHVCALYASIASSAALPGPVAMRSGRAQFFCR